VVYGFQNYAISGFYILSMALLCTHLYHGVWSMFQSVGISHPRYTPLLRKFAALMAAVIFIGNVSIPVSVMLGFVK
jgi:succinate dehydrogenase / fumarate reductase cytochrome b subunit